MYQTKLFQEVVTAEFGDAADVVDVHAVQGGDVNQAFRIKVESTHEKMGESSTDWFLKLNDANKLEMFAAEFEALQVIQESQCIRVPKPFRYAQQGGYSYLLMEYVDFKSGHAASQQLAGQQLAAMHSTLEAGRRFGWHRDNTIGSTHQSNRFHDDWVGFWQQERLMPQLDLAKSKGIGQAGYDKGIALCEQLGAFFDDYDPVPSLLHGDLWGGNMAFDADGDPVIYDPACYYGDRETDLAMTELFGGFGAAFYHAYNSVWPLHAGYDSRKVLYQLYHILNHYHLFGGSYGQRAVGMIDSLLNELSDASRV